MNSRFIAALAALCVVAISNANIRIPLAFAQGQNMSSGTISAANANGNSGPASANSAVTLSIPGAATLYIQTSNAGWSGSNLTVQETGTAAASTNMPQWVTPVGLVVNRVDGDTLGITGQSAWAVQVRGAQVRVVENGPWTSGSVLVSLTAGNPVLSAADGVAAVGSPANLIAPRVSTTSGLVASGAHSVSSVIGENASSTTVYVQLYDATTQPSNGTVPVFEFALPFGISTSPTRAYPPLAPNYLAFQSGVYVVLSTSFGTMNSATIVPTSTGIVVGCGGK